MTRKPDRPHSTSVRVAQAAFSSKPIELPSGVFLRTKSEKTVWRQFTDCRIDLDWRDSDLILLARAVRIEIMLRREYKILSNEGTVLEKEGSKPFENPRLKVIDILGKQQLSIFRALHINQTPSDSRVIRKAAKDQSRVIKAHGTNKSALFAVP